MTDYPIVRLVDRPEDGATVLVDFDSSGFRPLHDGFTLGAPSPLGDPRAIGMEWGTREVGFLAEAREATEFDAHRLLSDVARALLRERCYLFFQLTAAHPPVWAELLRSTPGELSLQDVYLDRATQRWRISLSLTAEPFLLGERVTLGPFTIRNNPTPPNGMLWPLPAIKGDAPAPLSILRAGDFYPFGVAALSTIMPLVKQAEYAHLGADTALATPSAPMSGMAARVSFATRTDLVARLTWHVDADVYDDATRRHLSDSPTMRLLAFVSRSNSSTFQLGVSSSVAADDTPRVVTVGTTSPGLRTVVDMGVVPLARSYQRLSGSPAADDLATLTIQAARTSGTGSLDIDCLVLVPADQLLVFGANTTTVPGVSTFVDGDAEQVAPISGTVDDLRVSSWAPTPMARGGFPKVKPGETNVLTWLVGAGTLTPEARADVAWTSDLTLSYRPRWLWLAAD